MTKLQLLVQIKKIIVLSSEKKEDYLLQLWTEKQTNMGAI